MLKSKVFNQITDFSEMLRCFSSQLALVNRVRSQMMHPSFLTFGFTFPCKWFVEKQNSKDIFITYYVKGLKRNVKIDMPKLNRSWVVQACSWDRAMQTFGIFYQSKKLNFGFFHYQPNEQIIEMLDPLSSYEGHSSSSLPKIPFSFK